MTKGSNVQALCPETQSVILMDYGLGKVQSSQSEVQHRRLAENPSSSHSQSGGARQDVQRPRGGQGGDRATVPGSSGGDPCELSGFLQWSVHSAQEAQGDRDRKKIHPKSQSELICLNVKRLASVCFG